MNTSMRDRSCISNANTSFNKSFVQNASLNKSFVQTQTATNFRAHEQFLRASRWLFASLILSVELFIFDSAVCSALLGAILPHYVTSYLELFLFMYTSFVALFLTASMLSPFVTVTLFDSVNATPKQATSMPSSPGPACESLETSILSADPLSPSASTPASPLTSTPHARDVSWVDLHKFGTSAAASPAVTRISTMSQRSSPMMASSPLSSSFNTSLASPNAHMRVPFQSRVSLSASSQSKLLSPIHTQPQLEALLRSQDDLSTSRDSSMLKGGSMYMNMLDATDLRGEPIPYQLSQALNTSVDDGNNVSYLRMNADRIELSGVPVSGSSVEGVDEATRFRQTLHSQRHSPKAGVLRRGDSSERRRRSLSSPERSLAIAALSAVSTHSSPEIGDHALSQLSDVEFQRCEPRMRTWIVQTILRPMVEQIDAVNKLLDKEHGSLHLHIGTSSVETLRTALLSKPELAATSLPFLLPLLEVHANVAYVVNRARELSSDLFMKNYTWNAGGCELRTEKPGPGARLASLPWKDHLPTDQHLVFSLFVAYMDAVTGSSSFVGSRVDQPFSFRHVVRSPAKPSVLHHAPHGFYLHWTSSSPPHVDVVVCSEVGTPSRVALPKGANNLFRALLSFVMHVKMNNNSRIEQMSIEKEGINLACVIAH